MSATNLIIAHPKNDTQKNALKAVMGALSIKFEEEKPYNKKFVEKIRKAKKQYEKGDYTTLKKDEIKTFLGLA